LLCKTDDENGSSRKVVPVRGAKQEKWIMRRLVCVLALCLLALPVFCQSTSKYQVATILDVQPHEEAGVRASNVTSYDVSVQVGDTIYVGRYTPPLGEIDVKYVAGRQILVEVGKQAIRYYDILGRSHEVPIESQKPAPSAKPGPRGAGNNHGQKNQEQ
jgi:hypothetical protein